jgi:hypothetical protein
MQREAASPMLARYHHDFVGRAKVAKIPSGMNIATLAEISTTL